jgi:hypothetical protein
VEAEVTREKEEDMCDPNCEQQSCVCIRLGMHLYCSAKSRRGNGWGRAREASCSRHVERGHGRSQSLFSPVQRTPIMLIRTIRNVHLSVYREVEPDDEDGWRCVRPGPGPDPDHAASACSSLSALVDVVRQGVEEQGLQVSARHVKRVSQDARFRVVVDVLAYTMEGEKRQHLQLDMKPFTLETLASVYETARARLLAEHPRATCCAFVRLEWWTPMCIAVHATMPDTRAGDGWGLPVDDTDDEVESEGVVGGGLFDSDDDDW